MESLIRFGKYTSRTPASSNSARESPRATRLPAGAPFNTARFKRGEWSRRVNATATTVAPASRPGIAPASVHLGPPQ